MADDKTKKNAEKEVEDKSADAAKKEKETKVEVKPVEDSKKAEPKEENLKEAKQEEKKPKAAGKKAKQGIKTEKEKPHSQPEEGHKTEKAEIEESEKGEAETSPAYLNHLNFYPQVRKDLPEVKIGDLIDVSYLVVEGGKERLQEFKGTVIAKKGTGISRTMTVRKTSYGIGVERIFPLNSKFVKKLKIRRHSKVRRAKLYYLRKLKGKASRLKELR